MYSYIRVKTEELDEVEDLLNNNNLEYESAYDSLCFSVEDRIDQLIENNAIMNNIKDISDAKKFVYSDFNPLVIDNQIMERLLIYQSSEEVK